MKKLLSSVAFCAIAMAASAQLPRIVLQGTGAPQVFTDLAAAITAAQPNDYIYLSGGQFALPVGTQITMPLHFVGAGIHPDSTSITGITTIQSAGSLNFNTSSAGSSFTGINFYGANELVYGILNDGSDDDPTNMVFQRCQFAADINLSETINSASSSTTFDECVFAGNAHPEGLGGSAVVTRCIFNTFGPKDFGAGGVGTLSMQHSVVLGTTNNENVSVQGGTYQDCIFNGTFVSVTSTFNNCLFVISSLPTGSVGSGNVFNLSPSTIFMNETDQVYQFTDDMHLAAGSPGLGAGTDGTDIGLYGSASPYKPGAVPYDPHYQLANIATATNGSGQLPVSFKVAAQSH